MNATTATLTRLGHPVRLSNLGLAQGGSRSFRSGARLRQWHLDLIMLGSLTAAASRLVPDPPRKVAVPLAVGASFVSTSWGITGLAAVAWKRWLRQR